jgi:CDP-paratose 2-epimerase
VVVFDRHCRETTAPNRPWLEEKGCHFRVGDVKYPEDLRWVIKEKKPGAIFHLAGNVAMTTSMTTPEQDFESNVLGTFNLLEAARNAGLTCPIIFASTNKVYGNFPTITLEEHGTRYVAPYFQDGFSEEMPLNFQTPYGCSKGAADQYVLDYARSFGLNTVSLRCSTIYGERQRASFGQGWIGWFCRQALEQKQKAEMGGIAMTEKNPFTIAGNGKQVRDLLFIDDAVECYLAAAREIKAARGQAFNVGGGIANSCSLLELFAWLEKEVGVKLEYERLPERPSDQKFFVANIEKAKRLLGWEPKIGKEEGLRRALTWERKQL